MEGVLQWGTEAVLWLQGFSPALDTPFRLLTFLGEQEFFMVFLPLVYWCLDRQAGSRLILLFLVSAYLNAAAKVVFDQPRPFGYDARVRQLVPAAGGGLPSGHTQGAVVVWGFVAARWRRRWVIGLAAALMAGIPLSRVYLGVHFPTDLLGGYLIGALLLWFYLALGPGIARRFGRLPLGLQLAAACGLPAAMAAAFAGPAGEGVKIGAFLCGMGTGFVLERRLVRFRAGGPWPRRLAAYAIGAAVLFALYYGLRAAFAGLAPAAGWRFARYALVGLWGAFGAPWLLRRLGLLDAEDAPGQAEKAAP